MKNKVLIACSATAGLLVASLIAVMLLFDANQFRPQLEKTMGEALGRKVTIGSLKAAPFSGGIALEDLSIADDASFSDGPFVTAKSVTAGVNLLPLIFRHTLRVQALHLKNPHVVLLRSESGEWNFSGLGATKSTASSAGFTAAMSISVEKITVAGGRIAVGRAGDAAKQRVYDNVDLEVRSLSLTSQFPFRITANTPGGGTAKLDGHAGPVNASDAAATPFQATADISHLNIQSTGFIDAASGLSGLVDFTGTFASDGRQLTSTGNVRATGVQLVAGGTPARVPIRIDYRSDSSRKTQTGVVKADVHIGEAVAHLTGNYTATGEVIALRMKLTGRQMPARDLDAALPAVGLGLPSGASLKQGTADVSVSVDGPVDRLVIAGSAHAENVLVAGFDLVGKLGALPSLGSATSRPTTRDTLVETFGATVRIAPGGIQVTGLNLAIQDLGVLTGAGTISETGNLDFAMRAKLSSSGTLGEISRVVSPPHSTTGIPFRIVGTTTTPLFVPDVGRAVGDFVSSPGALEKATSALGGLFGRKKR
jgi:AsmA protein